MLLLLQCFAFAAAGNHKNMVQNTGHEVSAVVKLPKGELENSFRFSLHSIQACKRISPADITSAVIKPGHHPLTSFFNKEAVAPCVYTKAYLLHIYPTHYFW